MPPSSRSTPDSASAVAAGGRPPLPPGVLPVEEQPLEGSSLPVVVHPGWRDAFPWLVQGTTTRGSDDSFDLAAFGSGVAGEVHARWEALGEELGMPRLVHGLQVHRAVVLVHDGRGPAGLRLVHGVDGHVARDRGVLLTVATADCIPVTVVDPVRRAVAMLHAGWRGVVAGIVEEGVRVLAERMRTDAGDLHVHLGPAICGACYEVGAEVHEALGLEVPGEPTPVDLRAAVARRLQGRGVPPTRISTSAWCTRCGKGDGRPLFFSHRGGCRERQLGFVGVAE